MTFIPYTNNQPSEITELDFKVKMVMVDEYDEDMQPTGQRIEERHVEIRALVSDQYGNELNVNVGDQNTITNHSLLTPQQIQDIQSIMTAFKTNAEGVLLAP